VRRSGTALLTGVLLVGAAMSAQAASWSASAGASVSQHDWAPAATLEFAGADRPLTDGRLQWRPAAALTVVDGHQHHWRTGTDRVVWVGSVGAAFSLRDSGWFVTAQAGAADRTTPALSSHLQFVTGVGWRGARLQLQLRHISNGDIGDGPNLGETMVMAGVRF
jgi:hypothetical protein